MGGLAGGGRAASGLKTCLEVDVFLTSPGLVFVGGGESNELDGVKGGLSRKGNAINRFSRSYLN